MNMKKNNFTINQNYIDTLSKDGFSKSMPPQTSLLLQKVSEYGGLKDYVLVGGTALSIHLNHRLSEDLDFCFTNGLDLNRNEIDKLLDILSSNGSEITPIINVKAQQDFLIAGDDILDHHQTYLIDDVKIEFFVNESRQLRGWMAQKTFSEVLPGVQIADIETLTHMKSNVILNRVKSRDFFDIKTLIEEGFATYEQIQDSMKTFSNTRLPEEHLISRLSPGAFHEDDEGFESLIDHTPDQQIKTELISFFKSQEKQYKIKEADKDIGFEP